MGLLAKVRGFVGSETGALGVNIALVTAAFLGLGVAGYGVVGGGDTASVAVSSTANDGRMPVGAANPAERLRSVGVCTPDGRQCAYDHDGDGMVDELRNHGRDQAISVYGKGLALQVYIESGWN